METSVIRDKLLEQRTIYQQSLKSAKEEAEKFQKIISEISEEQKEEMMRILNDKYFDVTLIDLERIQNDREYLNECSQKFERMILGLHSYLEAELDV